MYLTLMLPFMLIIICKVEGNLFICSILGEYRNRKGHRFQLMPLSSNQMQKQFNNANITTIPKPNTKKFNAVN